MTPYLIGSAVALAFAAYMFWESRRSTDQVARFVGTETSTAADVHALAQAAAAAAGPGVFAHRVELTGAAVPGREGPLVSEFTDTECLWYRHKVTHHYEETYRNSDGDRRTRRKEDVISDVSSKQPFLLRDDSGDIRLVPTARVDHPRKVASEFRQADGGGGTTVEIGRFSLTLPTSGDRTIGYEYEEWVLTPGTRVFVSGEAFDDRGELEVRGPKGPDKMLISTRSEDELLEHHRGERLKQVGLAAAGLVGSIVLLVLAFVLG
ncbi:E3 ubiquitin ligase family protein [Nocardioides acrostichi]|uniref:RING-type E3 ubiquitin transferase n=1 Tax=Nocardioides acrostichi TaxID=2784339 RepID=A0A930Y4J4_9ACTN|nr:E3 ubiquitin ligase family protein [Nocardioides acrostichi]MBF4160250.1 E3 ubiquitin ligase family protein [Nocardioides acrostichi]